MGCLSCALSRRRKQTSSNGNRNQNNIKAQTCTYTLQELQELATKVKSNFLTSQINIYNTDCNRYKSQIDELFKRI